ncbi:Uncharacterised protein [Acinetobacter phage MD-2021a]|nr:Uncharacterised protein [Acinetobacter phage MD-2021a]CAH1088949.1 Uncharacterised protein [Acinetobacter phage MD-2021a]
MKLNNIVLNENSLHRNKETLYDDEVSKKKFKKLSKEFRKNRKNKHDVFRLNTEHTLEDFYYE